MDMWGMLHTVSRADFIRSTIKILERYMDIGYEQSKKHGPQARQFVVLFDMAGFNVKQYTWRPAAEVVISLIKNYEANYPEILKCCYIINGKNFRFLAIYQSFAVLVRLVAINLFYCTFLFDFDSAESVCDCVQHCEALFGRVHAQQNHDIQK